MALHYNGHRKVGLKRREKNRLVVWCNVGLAGRLLTIFIFMLPFDHASIAKQCAWECAAHRWASKFVPCPGMHERGSWLRSGGVKRTTLGLLTLCFSIGVSAFFKLRVQSPRASLFLLPHFSASSLFFFNI